MLQTSFISKVKILEGFKVMSPKTSLNKNIYLSDYIALLADFSKLLPPDFVSADN